MSIQNRMNEILNHTTDAHQSSSELIEIIKNSENQFHTFGVILSAIQDSNNNELQNLFIHDFLTHYASVVRARFDRVSTEDMIESGIEVFSAHQKNLLSINPNLNAFNILEKAFSDKKEIYTNAFNNLIDFYNEKNIDKEHLSNLSLLTF